MWCQHHHFGTADSCGPLFPLLLWFTRGSKQHGSVRKGLKKLRGHWDMPLCPTQNKKRSNSKVVPTHPLCRKRLKCRKRPTDRITVDILVEKYYSEVKSMGWPEKLNKQKIYLVFSPYKNLHGIADAKNRCNVFQLLPNPSAIWCPELNKLPLILFCHILSFQILPQTAFIFHAAISITNANLICCLPSPSDLSQDYHLSVPHCCLYLLWMFFFPSAFLLGWWFTNIISDTEIIQTNWKQKSWKLKLASQQAQNNWPKWNCYAFRTTVKSLQFFDTGAALRILHKEQKLWGILLPLYSLWLWQNSQCHRHALPSCTWWKLLSYASYWALVWVRPELQSCSMQVCAGAKPSCLPMCSHTSPCPRTQLICAAEEQHWAAGCWCTMEVSPPWTAAPAPWTTQALNFCSVLLSLPSLSPSQASFPSFYISRNLLWCDKGFGSQEGSLLILYSLINLVKEDTDPGVPQNTSAHVPWSSSSFGDQRTASATVCKCKIAAS